MGEISDNIIDDFGTENEEDEWCPWCEQPRSECECLDYIEETDE